MIELVASNQEPITPFVKKVRSLYEDKGVSSILVIGGSGDYFDVADTVVMMRCYRCDDVTRRAKDIVARHKGASNLDAVSAPFGKVVERYPRGEAFQTSNKVAVRSKSVLSYGDIELELSGLEQIVSSSQTQFIAAMLQKIPSLALNNPTLSELLAVLDKKIDGGGLDGIDKETFHGGMARVRKYELAGAINRLRGENSMIQK